MKAMQCQNFSHKGSQIIIACMDKQCKMKKLCCWQCVNESHNSHQNKCIQIDHINTFIQYVKNKQVHHSLLSYGQKQIISDLDQLSKLMSRLQKLIKERIEKIKQQNLQEYLKINQGNQQGIEDWNNFLQGITQYVEVDNCVINLNKTQEGQLQPMEEQEIKFIKQSGQSIERMINQLNQTYISTDIPAQMKIGKLFFDQNRKHADFDIIDQSTIKKTKKSSFPMAFAHEGFDPNTQSYEFSFYIQNRVDPILIGVGNDEGIKENSYINGLLFRTTGYHGQYMISGIGHTQHHTDQKFQDKRLGITFKTGDKIQIKYDHVTKLLEFRKQSNKANIQIFKQNKFCIMPITDMTKILYPCVYCQFAGGQVQLMEY